MSLRQYLGPIPCIVGWHDWSNPTLVNRVGLSGEKQDNGLWDTETVPQHQAITQECRWCPRYRDREDLEPDDCWNYPYPPDEDASRFD